MVLKSGGQDGRIVRSAYYDYVNGCVNIHYSVYGIVELLYILVYIILLNIYNIHITSMARFMLKPICVV